jgi:hypothetical protein
MGADEAVPAAGVLAAEDVTGRFAALGVRVDHCKTVAAMATPKTIITKNRRAVIAFLTL